MRAKSNSGDTIVAIIAAAASLGCMYYFWVVKPFHYQRVRRKQRDWDLIQEAKFPEEDGMAEWLEAMAVTTLISAETDAEESTGTELDNVNKNHARVRSESRLHDFNIATKPSVCFQGSGCVIVYHIGVGRYIQQHFNLDNVSFLAASGGSIVAAMLALGLDMRTAFTENCRLAKFSRELPFGPFGRILDDVAKAFDDLMTDMSDAQIRNMTRGGRLILSLTHMVSWAPRLMYNYVSKKALRDSVWCSMNLPLFLCRFRSIGGEYYMDGGLTNNAPILNSRTVRVSPFDATAHIRPDDAPAFLQFLIPGDDAYMRYMYEQGYKNAKAAHGVFVDHGFLEI